MTVLKYDDVVKKVTRLDYYFGVFWKILCSTILMQSWGLTGWAIMEGGPFTPSPTPNPGLFNVKKAQTG